MLKKLLPYAGIPLLAILLFAVRGGTLDGPSLLEEELLLIFGYVIALSDGRTKRISNEAVLVMLAAWGLVFVPQLFLNPEAVLTSLLPALGGGLLGGGLFLLVYLISRKGLGGGDVKFMAVAGLYLGPARVLPVILLGSLLAGGVGLVLIALKKIGRKDAIALVPFLYAGILITIFFL